MDDFIELEEHFGAHNYHPLPVVLTREKGSGSGIRMEKSISTCSALIRQSVMDMPIRVS